MHISTVICVITAVHGETCPKGSPALYKQKPRYEGSCSTEVEAMCVLLLFGPGRLAAVGRWQHYAVASLARLHRTHHIAISVLPSNVTAKSVCIWLHDVSVVVYSVPSCLTVQLPSDMAIVWNKRLVRTAGFCTYVRCVQHFLACLSSQMWN